MEDPVRTLGTLARMGWWPRGKRREEADFQGDHLSSEGGPLLPHEVDHQMGLYHLPPRLVQATALHPRSAFHPFAQTRQQIGGQVH